ncbi:hypothetical protein [Anaerococcus sp.]|uniref:hypothetical protein n=1 Tax=Anaerococcus sp. TaxID=1872515 RepID=UPI0027BB0D06|nr:hypothetical protein [Anaerococcus sp.]
MRKYKKILLGLALSLSLIFLSEQISLADEKSSESSTGTETSESQGETGEEKDKLIITEEPSQIADPPEKSKGETKLETNETNGDKGKAEEEEPKENPDQVKGKEGSKEEKQKEPPAAKEVASPSKESTAKTKLSPKSEIKETNKLEKKVETSEKPKAEVSSDKAQSNKTLEKDSDTKTDDVPKARTDQAEPYTENSKKDLGSNTYLEDQKNETLVLEVGPNDNKDKNKDINLKTKAELKDEGSGADRIYIHLVGVFALTLMAVILIKVIKTKKKEA